MIAGSKPQPKRTRWVETQPTSLKSVGVGITHQYTADYPLAEDINSICDLAGGGLSDFPTKVGNDRLATLDGTVELTVETFKCETVIEWLSSRTDPLKKLVLIVSPHDGERVRFAISFFGPPHPALATVRRSR